MYARSGLGAVYPGSTCYDNSHDAGMVHCATPTEVIASAFNPFTIGTDTTTTTCSSQETSCVQNNMGGGGNPPPDPAALFAQYIPWIVVGVVALFALPIVLGRR